jgi:site-specific DNA-methyltransferase (adenine-specific)
MNNLIIAPPRELGQNPIETLTRWRQEAARMADVDLIRQRIELVSVASRWASKFGTAKEEVVRAAFAARLELQRRLGEVLAKSVKAGNPILIGDENCRLPEGVTWNGSSAAQALAAAPRKWFKKVVDAVLKGKRRTNVKEVELEARRMAAAQEAGPDLPEECEGIMLGDFREVGSHIADESVALVFTDPPYHRDSLHLYGEVAEFAARVLLPGGSLVVYVPNYALPEIPKLCGAHLRYWWTLAVVLPGDHALMREFGVRVGWKPMAWFTQGGRLNKQQIFDDVIQGGAKEKNVHEWQQQVMTAEALIRVLTAENDLVLDPMCGSATTLIAARRAGRRYLGIEVKPETATLARQRLRALP